MPTERKRTLRHRGLAHGHPDSGKADIVNIGSLALESGSITTSLYCEKANIAFQPPYNKKLCLLHIFAGNEIRVKT